MGIRAALGDVEGSLRSLDQIKPSFPDYREWALKQEIRSSLRCGNEIVAQRLWQEMEQPTWSDLSDIARFASAESSLLSFEQHLSTPLTSERRWLVSGSQIMQEIETGGTPEEWLALYESGLGLLGEHDDTHRRMNRLWYYAITFAEYEQDVRPWPTTDGYVIGDTEFASRALFAHGLYAKSFHLASSLPPVLQESWLNARSVELKRSRVDDFPTRDELQEMMGESPNDISRLLVSVAIGNQDWLSAIDHAVVCAVAKDRAYLLLDILSAACDAGVYVPKVRQSDEWLLEVLDDSLRLRVDLLRSDALAADESSMQEQFDDIFRVFHNSRYTRPYENVWICPLVAAIAVEYELDGVPELLRESELLLLERRSPLLHNPSAYVAEAYLILDDADSYRRMYYRRRELSPEEFATRHDAILGLRRWLLQFPELQDRIAAIDELELDAYDVGVRTWTIADWLGERGVMYREPFIW